jgi:hypothetical protein
MNSRRFTRSIQVLVAICLLAILCSMLLPKANAAQIQLKNDNNTAAGYAAFWQSGSMVGARLTPDSTMYPVHVRSVEFVLYKFSGATDTVQVRACIYTADISGPGTNLGCSSGTTISTFSPYLVSLDLSSQNIIINSPDSFFAIIEYMNGINGSTPSTMTDSSTNIPTGINYYKINGGSTWYEHYSFWTTPAQVGFNIIRATVDTNYLTPTATSTPVRAATRTPTPILVPTATSTPVPLVKLSVCNPTYDINSYYLPLVFNQVSFSQQSKSLGITSYWPYVTGEVGDLGLLVNVSNGNLLITAIDQSIPAPGINNILMRTYNSYSSFGGDFGNRWTSNVGNTVRLQSLSNGSVAYLGPSGEIVIFTLQNGSYISPPGFHSNLVQNPDGSFLAQWELPWCPPYVGGKIRKKKQRHR